jgi:aryl-alcohol dehydrogenase-like predicted oxidoreductase
MEARKLGTQGPAVSAMGIGTFAMGGLSTVEGGKLRGWDGTDDGETVRALHAALDLGVTFVDTADVYGAGHSEKLLGEHLGARRNDIILATKFGKIFDETTRSRSDDTDVSPAYIVRACEGSLRRLRTDHIDLYQLHEASTDLALLDDIIATLEKLVSEGKLRGYGWSTDDPARVAAMARGPNCIAVQQKLNLFEGDWRTHDVAAEHGLASVVRSPLATGLLTGKYSAETRFSDADLRKGWKLAEGERARQLRGLEAVRELLTVGGRSLTQGALGWLWAKSPITIPIPGFKTVAQVTDNVGALQHGPLPASTMAEIDGVLAGLKAAA